MARPLAVSVSMLGRRIPLLSFHYHSVNCVLFVLSGSFLCLFYFSLFLALRFTQSRWFFLLFCLSSALFICHRTFTIFFCAFSHSFFPCSFPFSSLFFFLSPLVWYIIILVTQVSGHTSLVLKNSCHPSSLHCMSPPYCSVTLSVIAAAPQLFPVGCQRSCRVPTTITNNLVEFLDKAYSAKLTK